MRLTCIAVMFLASPLGAQEVADPLVDPEVIGNEAVVDESQSYDALVNLNGDWQIVTYARIGQDAILGGDIILGRHDEVQLQSIAKLMSLLAAADEEELQRQDIREFIARAESLLENDDVRAAARIGTYLWPNKRIPYQISASITDQPLRQKISLAIQTWNSNSPVQLVPATASDQTTLRFEDAAGSGWLCQASLGFTPGSGGFVQLNSPCTAGAILHEIGHSAGLMHEHSRPDRGQYIAVASFAAEGANYGVVNSSKLITEYDLCSMMHYAPNQAPQGAGSWFRLTPEGEASLEQCGASLPANCRTVGQRCVPSAGDKQGIANLYPG